MTTWLPLSIPELSSIYEVSDEGHLRYTNGHEKVNELLNPDGYSIVFLQQAPTGIDEHGNKLGGGIACLRVDYLVLSTFKPHTFPGTTVN